MAQFLRMLSWMPSHTFSTPKLVSNPPSTILLASCVVMCRIEKKEFCALIRASVSLSFGYHQERLNQELQTDLRCLVSQIPVSWSKHLTWIEYAHNNLPCKFGVKDVMIKSKK